MNTFKRLKEILKDEEFINVVYTTKSDKLITINNKDKIVEYLMVEYYKDKSVIIDDYIVNNNTLNDIEYLKICMDHVNNNLNTYLLEYHTFIFTKETTEDEINDIENMSNYNKFLL